MLLSVNTTNILLSKIVRIDPISIIKELTKCSIFELAKDTIIVSNIKDCTYLLKTIQSAQVDTSNFVFFDLLLDKILSCIPDKSLKSSYMGKMICEENNFFIVEKMIQHKFKLPEYMPLLKAFKQFEGEQTSKFIMYITSELLPHLYNSHILKNEFPAIELEENEALITSLAMAEKESKNDEFPTKILEEFGDIMLHDLVLELWGESYYYGELEL